MGNRVSINKLCRKCMNELENEDAVCSECGFDRTEYNVPREHLRLDCILKGKYLVGICINETENEKTYAGWNLSYDTKIVIKEYFPKALVAREDHESGQVIVKKAAYQSAYKNNVNKYINQAELQSFNDINKISISETFQENGTAYYIINCMAVDKEAVKDEFSFASSYEIIKAGEYDTPEGTQEKNADDFRRVNGNLGRTYIQPAFHVQPARSNAATLVDEQKIVKNIAPNVLTDAKVSYVKITRPKAESLSMDIEAELEKSRKLEEEAGSLNDNVNSTLTIGNNYTTDSYDEGAGGTEEDNDNEENQTSKSYGIVGFIKKNKTITAIAFVAILFIIVGIKLLSGNSDDGSENITSQTAQGTTDTTKETDATTDNSDGNKNDTAQQDKQNEEALKEPFKFTEPEGVIAKAVCSQTGKKVDELTVGDIQGIKLLNLADKGLTDVSDLQYFTSLESLDISQNKGITDASYINGLSEHLKYVCVIGCAELVEQLPDIDYVAGRKNEVTVIFHYTNATGKYSDKALWVWTANPGRQFDFETEEEGSAIASGTFVLYKDRTIGFKIKKSGKDDWSDVPNEFLEDREFQLPCNKPGYQVDVYITQNQKAYNVNVNPEKESEN